MEFNEKYFQQQQQTVQSKQQTQNGLTSKSAQSLNTSSDSSHEKAIIQQQQSEYGFPVSLYKCNVITVDNLRKDVLHKLFNLAHDLKVLTLCEKDLTMQLRGKVVAEMFFEPSTRTQCSFTAAAQRLGGSVVYMDQQHSSIKKGETLQVIFLLKS
jgi:hypothetical protein